MENTKKVTTKVVDNFIYNKCKLNLGKEMQETLDLINNLMNAKEPDIEKITNLFKELSALDRSIALLNRIKASADHNNI